MHKEWHAERDARKAAELCFSVERKPNPDRFVDKVESVHSSAESPQHMKDSKHSCTAASKLRKAALCALCGTTRVEKTSFPKEAQWRSNNSAT